MLAAEVRQALPSSPIPFPMLTARIQDSVLPSTLQPALQTNPFNYLSS